MGTGQTVPPLPQRREVRGQAAGVKEQCLVMGRYKREVELAGGAAKYAGDAAATMLWEISAYVFFRVLAILKHKIQ